MNGNGKPIYSVWENSIYVIKLAWERSRTVLFVIIAQVLLTVIVSTVGIFLPKIVVTQITSGATASTLVISILSFTLATVVLQVAKNYLDSTAGPRRTALRIWVCHDILMKTITTDYANLEEMKFTDAKQKAYDVTRDWLTPTEQIYYCFLNLGTNFLGLIVYVTLLASVNPFVMIVTTVTAFGGVYARRKANKWQFAHDNEKAAFNKRIQYINSISEDYTITKDIKLFAMIDWLKEIYDANIKLAFDFSRRSETKQLIADAVNIIGIFFREGIAYIYLIWLVLYSRLSVGDFILLFAAINGFSIWISGILEGYASLTVHSLNYCRLREFLEYPDKYRRDQGDAIPSAESNAYTLELRNVNFRYPGAEENVLENINLTIKAGEKLAVVGLNGVGKTTLVKLLCGFYDPTQGEVLLNGKDIRLLNRNQYYALFSTVFQESNILPLSIAENVSQQLEDEIDRDKIGYCLKLAGLDKKINSLKKGIMSQLVKNVNEDAIDLSGGEIQKLLLARALYKDSPIFILDEPTAALDPIAESELYNKYKMLSAGKTSVYISHRLASTRFCDCIALIENKMIAEIGTHDELMACGGKYAELFEIQSKYYKKD